MFVAVGGSPAASSHRRPLLFVSTSLPPQRETFQSSFGPAFPLMKPLAKPFSGAPWINGSSVPGGLG